MRKTIVFPIFIVDVGPVVSTISADNAVDAE